MDKKKKPRKRRKSLVPPEVRRARRMVFIGGVLIFAVAFLVFRIWYIQHNYGEVYTQWAAMERARREIRSAAAVFAPERGRFWDRHLQPITGTQQVFTVSLDIEALMERNERHGRPDNDILTPILDRIFHDLGVPSREIEERMRVDPYTGELIMRYGRNRFVLSHNVPPDIAIPLAEDFPEINREEASYRWYQDPFFAPQVIGFTRGDAVWGLEAFYQRELEGEEGRNIWAAGETETVPVRHGHTIVTTLDSTIQRYAQYYVDRTFIQHPSAGVGMIVMDPHTSRILAMAQAPTFSLADPFNPDYFTDPALVELWPYLSDGERANRVMSLWRNYHITGSNEPGSVFKPFVIAAAIEEGVIDHTNNFFCDGARIIHEMRVPCWSRYGCGSLSLRRALYRSCNLAMVDINRMMGNTTFYRYRGYFGFGDFTGIDFPGEDPVSHPLVMYPLARLNAVEMATSSMGQGFNTTTLQIINGYAALINGGVLRQPMFVSHILDSNDHIVHENEPQIVRQVISRETSDFIRNEMRFVVSMQGSDGGTGRHAYIAGHDIGGKTGTAQQGVREDGINSLTFVAFLPVHDPQYLVLLTIDRIEGEDLFAGGVVAPILREFLLDLIRIRNIPAVGDAEPAIADLFGTPMPDFTGQRLTEAVRTAIGMQVVGYQAIGGGTIITHTWPPAGHPMPETAPIIFYTDPDSRISERMVTVPDVVGLTAAMAERVLDEANLSVVLVAAPRAASAEEDFSPQTFHPEHVGEDFTPPPPPYTVYQQSPAPGMEIEQGTQVIIRAR